MPKRSIVGGLIGGVLTLSLAAAPGAAVGADPALPEWSGSVLGGAELTFPQQERFLDFVKISSNTNFSLGIDQQGRTWGWGINGWGQLGNTDHFGFYQFIPYPAPMHDANGDQLIAKDVAMGANFSITLDKAGKAWSYGANAFGQLGNPKDFRTNELHVEPLPVVNESGDQVDFERVVAGSYTGYGLDIDGKAWAWGRNENGELANSGLNTGFMARFPWAMPLNGADGQQMTLKQLSAGEEFAIAVDDDGKAWGWGRGGDGQLGPQASAATVAVPVPITDEHSNQFSFTEVATGRGFALGLDAAGNAWAWGDNSNGRLGNPAAGAQSAIPVPVVDETGTQQQFSHVEAGLATGYGIKADGTVWAWGQNNAGQLGDPTVPAGDSELRGFAAPVLTADGSPFTAAIVSGGGAFAAGISPADTKGHTPAWAWGDNRFGQIGSQVVPSGPVPDNFSSVPVEIKLPQPTDESRLYIGTDDTVGITGKVSGDTVAFTLPAHTAGRVPLFLSWTGDGVLREPVGFYTYLLAPTISVSPASVEPTETARATISLPAAEIPYIGNAAVDVSLETGLSHISDDETESSAFTGQFDSEGILSFPVTADTAGSYEIGAKAVVRETGEADVIVSKDLSAPAVFVEDATIVTSSPTETPKSTKKPTKKPTTTSPATPATTEPENPNELASTGAEQPFVAVFLLLGTAAGVIGLTRLRKRAVNKI